MGWRLDEWDDEDMELDDEEVEGVWDQMMWSEDILIPLA
jgi:hypothetical protein